jgi:uncharacterized protein DUF1579
MSARRTSLRAVCRLLIVAGGVAPLGAKAQADDQKAIVANMDNLTPLIGTWNAVAEFHHRDGTTTEEVGTYKVSRVLEGTYMQWEMHLSVKNDPSRHHSMLLLVTYNPVTKKYDSTYFYSGWAQRVTEIGEYDDKSKEFRTVAFIPLEDGVHDENVRTITRVAETRDIQYQHYSRYNGESTEHNDLTIGLTRAD